MTRALALTVIALAAALAAAGCGSDSSEETDAGAGQGGTGPAATTSEPSTGPAAPTPEPSGPSGIRARSCGAQGNVLAVRAVGLDCAAARGIVAEWSEREDCSGPGGGSRFACSVRGYRCLATAAGQGIAVSCARPGRSISFLAKRR